MLIKKGPKLSKSMGSWETGHHAINGFQQFCREWRPITVTGPPVLALHGSLTQSGMWIKLAEDAGSIPMTCPDQRGFGLSEDPGTDACAEFASDAVALAEKLLPSRYVVMGHSFACPIALQTARKAAGQVIGVVLVDPVVQTGTGAVPTKPQPVAPRETFATFEACEHYFRASEEGEWSNGSLQRFIRDIMIRDDHELWHFPYASARLKRLRAFTASSQSDYNLFAEVKAVRRPVLMFRGAMSKRFPASAESPFLEAFVSKPRVVVCPRSGHFPTATDTNIMATELKIFLRELPESF